MDLFTKIIIAIVLIALLGCKEEKNSDRYQEEISLLDKTYSASGSDKIGNSTISFKFRDKLYRGERADGHFKLERIFTDSIGMITDVYTNNGFKRYLYEIELDLPDSMANRYQESVNSVHYFSVLPYGLKDSAVNSEEIGEVEIKGNSYKKLRITFNEEGGGQDFEDVFIYWVNTETNLIDYLAYKFNVDGGGLRFREAYNSRIIEGVRIVDYKNYKPTEENAKLEELDSKFDNDQLELLSTIDLVDVKLNFN